MCAPCVINLLDSSTIKSERFFLKVTLNNPKHGYCKLIFSPLLNLYVQHDSVYNIPVFILGSPENTDIN
jgi:hypothetical protein